jgi:hypothetical protein
VGSFIDDLLKDYKTDKWSLGRVSFALLFVIILVSVIISVCKTGQLPDVPSGMIYLIALLLGYNATTKFVLRNFNGNGNGNGNGNVNGNGSLNNVNNLGGSLQ